MIYIIKKDGSFEKYDKDKIISACSKSAKRALDKISESDYEQICTNIKSYIHGNYEASFDPETDIYIPITDMHNIVEMFLSELYPNSGDAYRQYRNYKTDFVHMMDDVYLKVQDIRYHGDVSNANTDSTMISTQRSLAYGELNKKLYQKFFLNKDELAAANDGYIYIHDMKDRLDGFNCLLFDISNVLNGGFEMGNVWYNEPKTIDVAFDVISDIAMSAASQSYGGFTLPQIDFVLEKYAAKSYKRYFDEYFDILDGQGIFEKLQEDSNKAHEYALKKLKRDIEQGFQSWEYRFNTVGSSRGDYPFVAVSFGLCNTPFGKIIIDGALEVRKNGQGKTGYKKPVLFPKLTFLYDEKLHGEGAKMEEQFENAIDCSSKTMYPDFLSMSGNGYVPSMYQKYGKVVSPMGCRAFLSPWYIDGGMTPANDEDYPVFEGRSNLGAISLHLPMILAKAKAEVRDFYEVLDCYLEMIRNLHIRTLSYLKKKKAGTNPLCFCQGGVLNGNIEPNEEIGDLLNPMTMSFGITALNELQVLYNGKSIAEDGEFALEVMQYINSKINEFKREDNILYAIYGTPGESLVGLQVEQFRKMYGVIKGVSDREYVSNSFHCGVWEDITPIQKQDLESRFWDLFNGGKIQYCKYPIGYNKKAIKTLVRRAMDMGFYEGVNLSLAYCENCGYEELDMNVCPKCGSDLVTKIQRMNGYLGYSRIHGESRFNQSKLIEFSERLSM